MRECHGIESIRAFKELVVEELTNNSEAGLCGIVSNVVNQSVSIKYSKCVNFIHINVSLFLTPAFPF